VKIDLIVRGICCLRPGNQEPQREHSRHQHRRPLPRTQPHLLLSITAGKPEAFSGQRRLDAEKLSSGGWKSPFPIEDPTLRDEIVNEVLPRFLNDHIKARQLQSDGTYIRLKPEEGAPRSQAQLHFRERSRGQARKLAEAQPAPDDDDQTDSHYHPPKEES
jgi:polyphosphate kinase